MFEPLILARNKKGTCTKMSLSTQTQIRLPTIKQGLLEKQTQTTIANQCKVTRKTIVRDIKAWVKTPDFFTWLRIVWLDKYKKVPDELAFKEITKLLAKTIPQETHSIGEIREIKLVWKLDESNINAANPI
jgi:hypothetical protein